MNNKLFIAALSIVLTHNVYCMDEGSNQSQPHTVSVDEEFKPTHLAIFNAIQQGEPNLLQNVLQALNNQEMSHPINQSITQNMSTFTKELIEKEKEKKLLKSTLKELASKRDNKQY